MSIKNEMKIFFGIFLGIIVGGITFFSIVFLSIKIMQTAEAGSRANSEAWYVDNYCKGVIEYRNSDGTRTDCLVGDESQEFDFANKWYECITQALHYSTLNNNIPACVLIRETSKDDKYIKRAKDLVGKLCLNVKIRELHYE